MAWMDNDPALRRAGRLVACSVGALLLTTTAFGWPVANDAGDVTIDGLAFKSMDGDSFAIAHVEVANTNLSKDEIVKLLTPDTPADDDLALARKLKADKFAIPSIDVVGKDGAKIHLSGMTAGHIDAGKLETLDIASVDATGTDKGGPVTVKLGPLHLDGVDVARLLARDDPAAAALPPSRLVGLTLSGIDVVAPDPGDAPGQSVHVGVGSIVVHNDYAGDSIEHGDAKISGVVIEPSPGSEAGKTLASFGYSKIELAMTVGVKYEADAKTFAFENFTVDGVEMGSVGLKANFTDVAPTAFGADSGARIQALLEAGVAAIEVKLVNGGLFDKALAYSAKQQGVAPDALRAQWSAMVGQTAPVLLGGSPASIALAAEAQKFIADPKNLMVTVKAKSGALKAGDFMAIGDPSGFVGKLDVAAAANR